MHKYGTALWHHLNDATTPKCMRETAGESKRVSGVEIEQTREREGEPALKNKRFHLPESWTSQLYSAVT